MWICLNNAFISIVQKDANNPGLLTVRARRRGDLERVFPTAVVVEGGGTDYPFRTVLGRSLVVSAVAERLFSVNYSNFKDSVKDDDLHNAYSAVWGVMQRTEERKHKPSIVGDLFGAFIDDDDEEDDLDESYAEYVCAVCEVSLIEDEFGDYPYCPTCGEEY